MRAPPAAAPAPLLRLADPLLRSHGQPQLADQPLVRRLRRLPVHVRRRLRGCAVRERSGVQPFPGAGHGRQRLARRAHRLEHRRGLHLLVPGGLQRHELRRGRRRVRQQPVPERRRLHRRLRRVHLRVRDVLLGRRLRDRGHRAVHGRHDAGALADHVRDADLRVVRVRVRRGLRALGLARLRARRVDERRLLRAPAVHDGPDARPLGHDVRRRHRRHLRVRVRGWLQRQRRPRLRGGRFVQRGRVRARLVHGIAGQLADGVFGSAVRQLHVRVRRGLHPGREPSLPEHLGVRRRQLRGEWVHDGPDHPQLAHHLQRLLRTGVRVRVRLHVHADRQSRVRGRRGVHGRLLRGTGDMLRHDRELSDELLERCSGRRVRVRLRRGIPEGRRRVPCVRRERAAERGAVYAR